MNLTLITAAITAAMGFGLGWQLQGHQITKLELQHADQAIADKQSAFRTSERNQGAVIAATNAAASRATGLRRDADRARTELDGLRSQSAAALRTAATSLDACLDRASAFSVVLDQCGSAYQELGATADRLASDRQTITEAWPK